MIVFERVSSLQIMQSIFRKWLFVTMFLLLLIVTSYIHPVYATDEECRDLLMEGFATSCQPYLDANDKVIPEAIFYKCADTVLCNPEPGTDKIRKRCCMEPGPGSYGGRCLDPNDIDDIDRNDLGKNAEGTVSFMNIKPKRCEKVNEDQLSPSGERVYEVPFIPPPPGSPIGTPNTEQSLEDLFMHNTPPTASDTSRGGFPIVEETILMNVKPVVGKEKRMGVSWYYEQRDDMSRGYFLGAKYPLNWCPVKLNGLCVEHFPKDPREVVSGSPISNLKCKVGNVFLEPLYSGITSLTKALTSQNNLPDISLLCTKGSPVFANADQIVFETSGKITGFDKTQCHCVDSDSGPGSAAVLLCTRFIAGIEDGGGTPWVSLIPTKDASGGGSNRFAGLLFGELLTTSTIDAFHAGIKDEIQGFFNPVNQEVEHWITQLTTEVHLPKLMSMRFFGTVDPPTPPLSATDVQKFKDNPFVRQYISCLACAHHGGFPSALGCMPMDKVERFLGEGVLGIGITFAGAFSVLCIIFGAIQFQLSGGESAKVQKAQKLITQCVVGLLIIIFSIFLLRFVGVNLLRIYGLS